MNGRAPRVVAYALLGVAAFAVFLIVRAPASLLATGLERATHGAIVIGAATGTVWSGSGQLSAPQAVPAPVLIGRVSWTVNPLWLFAGKIGLRVAVAGGGADVAGHFRIGLGSVALEGVKGAFPARLVSVLYAPAELLGPDGRIEISAPHLRWSRKNGVTGAAEIQWREAASSLTRVRPLGDYRLSLEGQGADALLKLETIKGELVLNGAGRYAASQGAFEMAGTAHSALRNPGLDPLLQMMGAGNEVRHWSFRVPLGAASS